MLSRKSVRKAQCSGGDNPFRRFLSCSAPATRVGTGMHASESNVLGYSLKLPAQPAQARSSRTGFLGGDEGKECSRCMFSGPDVFVVDCRRTLPRAKARALPSFQSIYPHCSCEGNTGRLPITYPSWMSDSAISRQARRLTEEKPANEE